MVSDCTVPPSLGSTQGHERKNPSDLRFQSGGGSGLELEVEAACVSEGFTDLCDPLNSGGGF